MGKDNPLTQQVNFMLSVAFLGSVALLAIITILEAAEMENPFARHNATIEVYQEF